MKGKGEVFENQRKSTGWTNLPKKEKFKGWEIVWGYILLRLGIFFWILGLDTFCMLFPAFRSWKLLRPNVFTAFWS